MWVGRDLIYFDPMHMETVCIGMSGLILDGPGTDAGYTGTEVPPQGGFHDHPLALAQKLNISRYWSISLLRRMIP